MTHLRVRKEDNCQSCECGSIHPACNVNETSIECCNAIGSKFCDLSGVVVVIPALNEEASLPLVLRDLPAVGRVIVVDNGSTDGTSRVAIDAGATVVTEAQRR